MLRAAPGLVLVLCGVVGGHALDLRVNGDVLFSMHLSEAAERRLLRAQSPAQSRATPLTSPARIPALDCRYHYPEQEQVDAILSNMINELTKVFVRANLFLKSEDNTRNPGVWRAEDAEEANTTAPQPLLPAPTASVVAVPLVPPSPSPPSRSNRFKVVNSKNTQFFEHIFHNMTKEFSSVYNGSAHVARARRDPCRQQEAVRGAWRDLMRRALSAFRRAALNCVQDYLKIQEYEERTKTRLVRFLLRELGKMRTRHLQLLCDQFQLCLDEGLLA